MCRCTVSPSSTSWGALDPSSSALLSCFSGPPPRLAMNLAPGYASGPLFTASCSRSRLCLPATSGNVITVAILRGTPTSSMLMHGSGVITVLAL